MKCFSISATLSSLIIIFACATPRTCQALPKPDRGGVPDSKLYDYGVMGPPATPEIVAAANAAVSAPMPSGPFQPTWTSIAENYQVPQWFLDAKFGIFMHWGLYSVPAHHNEWYEKHMYGGDLAWHTEKFGPPEKFGYKDFIPLFTQSKFKPDYWATLFQKAGAKFVIPTAQHHDNFALWDSKVTPFNSVKMGPHRDLIGDLATAVRKTGLKFGVSNHGIENFTFINPDRDLDARLKAQKADLYDPKWAAFYNVADRSPAAMTRFLSDWLSRNLELIDKYQPDILWFDNGVNLRVLDPLKERIAAYYYNRAFQWGKQVSICTKFVAYAPSNDDSKQIGSIIDFEKVGSRSPAGIRPAPWVVDDAIGSTWGYTSGMRITNAEGIIGRLVDTVSKNGTYLLNLSPMADGTLPKEQQSVLLQIGAWLQVNGEGIYGTHNWRQFGEGANGTQNYRFTVKGDTLYVFALGWPKGNEAVVTSLAAGSDLSGKISKVELLGRSGPLSFSQDKTGLHIKLPANPAPAPAYTFKITGLKLE